MVTHNGQRFKIKVLLVTGAAHGIGRSIALRFGSEGGQVIVNDVNAQGTEDTVQTIITNGGFAIPGIADVSDKSQVDHLFDTVLEHFGTVDVLVNNAGLINVERHFLEADEAWWDRVLAVNLKSVFLCSFRAARVMAAYDASKGGIEALTRAMALDLAPYGIRVNALIPGAIDTQGMSPEIKRERGASIPLGRVGEPEELAGPAAYLASDDASYVTGHILAVDGGLLSQQRSPQVDIFPLSRFPKLEVE